MKKFDGWMCIYDLVNLLDTLKICSISRISYNPEDFDEYVYNWVKI